MGYMLGKIAYNFYIGYKINTNLKNKHLHTWELDKTRNDFICSYCGKTPSEVRDA